MFYTLYFLTFNGITYIKKSPIIDGTVIAFHGGYKVGQTIPLNAALLVFSHFYSFVLYRTVKTLKNQKYTLLEIDIEK